MRFYKKISSVTVFIELEEINISINFFSSNYSRDAENRVALKTIVTSARIMNDHFFGERR